MHQKKINRPSPKVERSTWEIGASLDFESSKVFVTGKDVDLTVSKHGPAPVYLTVQRAFPAYIGLPQSKEKSCFMIYIYQSEQHQSPLSSKILLKMEISSDLYLT